METELSHEGDHEHHGDEAVERTANAVEIEGEKGHDDDEGRADVAGAAPDARADDDAVDHLRGEGQGEQDESCGYAFEGEGEKHGGNHPDDRTHHREDRQKAGNQAEENGGG